MKHPLSEKNKAFWAKSAANKRIAVAKDVIAAIKTGFYRAYSGVYFRIDNLKKDINNPSPSLQSVFKNLKQKGAVCEVCGIGACFTSLVRVGNKAATDTFLSVGIVENYDSINDNDMRDLLRRVFSPSQLSLIESAFEESNFADAKDTETRSMEKEKAIEFGKQYPEDDESRLIAIMGNIIKNKGTFKP